MGDCQQICLHASKHKACAIVYDLQPPWLEKVHVIVKMNLQCQPWADEAWRHVPLALFNFGIGRRTGPDHLWSCCIAALVATCRDVYLWFYAEWTLEKISDRATVT